MHSHCAMSNERESEKEAQHQCVTMQTLTALNRMSPWTTCAWWLERELSPKLSQSSGSAYYACRQPRSLMRATQLPCTHLSVSLLLPVWEKEGTGTPTYNPFSPLPSSHLVDMESSVKGRPLHLLHLSSILGHYFNLVPLTFWWLIYDFWWIPSPCVL